MFRTADAPAKSSNSFTLAFGLLNIPLAVYTSTEDTAVKRNEFTQVGDEWHEVGRRPYDKDTGDSLDHSQVVRRAQASDGTWVTLTDDEIAACTMDKGVAEILSFVPLTKLHTNYLTVGLLQVRAKTSGLKVAQKAQADKTFGVFLAGLKAKKVAALIKVAMRGPARFAAITPEGDMLLLQASDGIRAQRVRVSQGISDREVELVGNLIDMIGVGTPEITDDTASKVQTYIDAQAAKGDQAVPVTVVEPEVVEIPDLFAQLSAAVDAVKASKVVK